MTDDAKDINVAELSTKLDFMSHQLTAIQRNVSAIRDKQRDQQAVQRSSLYTLERMKSDLCDKFNSMNVQRCACKHDQQSVDLQAMHDAINNLTMHVTMHVVHTSVSKLTVDSLWSEIVAELPFLNSKVFQIFNPNASIRTAIVDARCVGVDVTNVAGIVAHITHVARVRGIPPLEQSTVLAAAGLMRKMYMRI